MDRILDNEYKQIVLRPFTYVRSLPCKNIRGRIGKAFNYFYNVPDPDFDSACEIIDILHNASLVIDDIEDGSDLRRGQPAAHIKYGLAQAINSANYAYFEVGQKILEDKDESCEQKLKRLNHYISAMISMHIGQGMELYWRDENTTGTDTSFVQVPTEEQYLHVIVHKTSGLFVLLNGLLKIKSCKEIDISKLANLMGQHFQIRDDLLNLVSNTYEAGKGYCEDITEGKFSFPIIYALNQKQSKNGIGLKKAVRLMEILRLKTSDIKLKKEAFEIIKESGALEYTREKVKVFKNEIIKEIDRLGGNPIFFEYIDAFSDSF